LTFSLRAARLMRRWAREFDVIHDNQTLGYGLLAIQRLGRPLVTTIHHPMTVGRRIDLGAANSAARRRSLLRWYGFVRMQGRVARRLRRVITVSRSSAPTSSATCGCRRSVWGDPGRRGPNGLPPDGPATS
jgi:hypothetical protein